MAKQDVEGIVRAIVAHQSRVRRIPLNRRQVSVSNLKGADFRVNRHEVEIDKTFATTGNPISPIDKVLDAVEEFDRRDYEEAARRIVEIKSLVLRWAPYLQRKLPTEDYKDFILSLLPEESSDEVDVVPIETLAPDWIEQGLDLEYMALISEGERFIDKEIYFRA